jgi:hypothetical protein
MSSSITSITATRPALARQFLRTGVSLGLAGGLAEIAFIWLYTALTGGSAANVARQIGVAVGLPNASAATGIAVHLALAIVLGLGLALILQSAVRRAAQAGQILLVSLATLALVWSVNFLLVLPMLSPGFVHLLPYPVTFISKLLFGGAAAATLCWIRTQDGE